MPNLENRYLSIHRDFMLSELGAGVPDWPYSDTDYTTYCLLRFGVVVHPNDSAIDDALSAYATSDNESWRQAARSALELTRGQPIGQEPGSG